MSKKHRDKNMWVQCVAGDYCIIKRPNARNRTLMLRMYDRWARVPTKDPLTDAEYAEFTEEELNKASDLLFYRKKYTNSGGKWSLRDDASFLIHYRDLIPKIKSRLALLKNYDLETAKTLEGL